MHQWSTLVLITLLSIVTPLMAIELPTVTSDVDATETPPPVDPQKATEAFLDELASGRIEAAYDALLAGSYIELERPEVVEAVKRHTDSVLPRMGEIIGHELIDEEDFGDSVKRLVYLLKSSKHPTVWVFHYYRPTDRWSLISVNFGDQLGVLEGLRY